MIAVAAPCRSAWRHIARAGATAVIAVLLGTVALFLIVPRVTHGAVLTVLSGSMAPDLPVGSVVMVRSVDPKTLRTGDIATYQQRGGSNLITHRVVAIDKTTTPYTFTFRGDRNPVPDPQPVPASAIRGKVWFDVPLVGTLRERLGSVRTQVVLFGVFALSAYSLWQFGSVLRDRRRRA
jgi:signal peptidase I